MNTRILMIALATGSLMAAGAADAGQGVVRARGANGAVTALKGPQGNTAARAHRTVQNADGSTTVQRRAVRRTGNATTVRGGDTTVNPQTGSYESQRARARSNANGGTTARTVQSSGQYGEGGTRSTSTYASGTAGTVQSNGTVSRSADGTRNGARTTTATSNATGITYTGTTYRDPATGEIVHGVTCTDAAGQTIACPN